MFFPMSDPAIRETEWYLRDHLFRQSNAGKTTFKRESLPDEMAGLYLRYKNTDLERLSHLMAPVIEILVARKVLDQEGNDLKMRASLSRLQCAKCFYINYLIGAEQRVCLRCRHSDLHDFPKKKA